MAGAQTEAGTDPRVEVAEARRNGHADPLEDNAWVLANEAALTKALVAGHAVIVWQPFAIPRYQIETAEGPKPLEFRVRGLSQSEFDRCEKQAQVPTGRRVAGGGRETKRNDALYALLVVVAATHPDDRARLWGSASLRGTLGVAGETDVAGTVLNAGEVARVVAEVADLSGFLPSDEDTTKSPVAGGR